MSLVQVKCYLSYCTTFFQPWASNLIRRSMGSTDETEEIPCRVAHRQEKLLYGDGCLPPASVFCRQDPFLSPTKIILFTTHLVLSCCITPILKFPKPWRTYSWTMCPPISTRTHLLVIYVPVRFSFDLWMDILQRWINGTLCSISVSFYH